jgi:hypothetical protein
MTRSIALALAATLLLPGTVSAQTTKENFSYSAPSGIFGEGTAKWQFYRFIHEDRERTEALRAGRDPEVTGSIQGSATSNETVRQRGEQGRRRTR